MRLFCQIPSRDPYWRMRRLIGIPKPAQIKLLGSFRRTHNAATHQGKTLRWDGHLIDSSTDRWLPAPRRELVQTLFVNLSKQKNISSFHAYARKNNIWILDLNQLSARSWESLICRRIDRVTIPSESLPLIRGTTLKVVYYRNKGINRDSGG